MRIVLVGLGSIGRRHLRNLRALEPDSEIIVVRHARNDDPIPENVNRIAYSLDEALQAPPDLGLICGPTTTHVNAGVALLDAGAHLFVEKPLAADVAGARALIDASHSAQRALVVGYNLRFSPSLRALRAALHGGMIGRTMSLRAEVGQYLPDWRPGTDYRTSNSALAALGGGVQFELSHEIDYVRWLLGDVISVDAILARTSDLEIDVADTAELLLRFASGAVASVHMDMAQRAATRTCRIAGTEGTLTWDALVDEVRCFRPGNGWSVIHAGEADHNTMYVEEMAHALACARGEAMPLITGIDGLRIVEIAQMVAPASREGRRVFL